MSDGGNSDPDSRKLDIETDLYLYGEADFVFYEWLSMGMDDRTAGGADYNLFWEH